MHTIKGNARVFKITTIQDIAHAAEDFFAKVREGTEPVTPEVILDIREKISTVGKMLQEFERLGQNVLTGGTASLNQDTNQNPAVRLLQQASEFMDEAQRQLIQLDESPSTYDSGPLEKTIEHLEALAEQIGLCSLLVPVKSMRAAFDPSEADTLWKFSEALSHFEEVTERTRRLAEQIRACSTVESFLDEASSLGARLSDELQSWTETLENPHALHQLIRTTHSLKASARTVHIEAIEAVAHAVEEDIVAIRDKTSGSPEPHRERIVSGVQTLRSMLDDCAALTIVPQENTPKKARPRSPAMKIPKARILELRKAYKDLSRALEASRDHVPSRLRTHFEEVGQSVQALTMVPLSELFDRFAKMIFDLSKELGKRVEDLRVTGEDIYVDSNLVEKMRDVLIHALRNTVDHGIETPEERRRTTKPDKGSVSVDAFWSHDNLVFEISDDGRGIDLTKVKSKAFQKRILSEEELDRIGDQDLLNLLFLPGFSTAETVTDVSGRGVGMDVVAAIMRELKGSAAISSQLGVGTKLTLQIPADYYQQL